METRPDPPPATCLNCEAMLAGPYCAACGQRAVDLAAPSWDVARDAFADATDVDGRALRTVRAIGSPGLLTLEHMRGRRAPYVGPVKLFLIAGAALSTTWVVTRGIDARYYEFAINESAAAYIDTVVRGLLASCAVIALVSWAFSLGRRRIIDEGVFALHTVAALSLWIAAAIWLGTAWKYAWGTVTEVPSWMPSLVTMLFLPAGAIALGWIALSIRRVYGVTLWAAALRTIVLAGAGFAVVLLMITRMKS